MAESFSYDQLIASGEGRLFGPDAGRLPLPPMLMFDRIVEISETGGAAGVGLVRAEFDYVRRLADIVHLYNAYRLGPDAASRDRLCAALGARDALLDSFYDARGHMKPIAGWPEKMPLTGSKWNPAVV